MRHPTQGSGLSDSVAQAGPAVVVATPVVNSTVMALRRREPGLARTLTKAQDAEVTQDAADAVPQAV